MLTLSIEEKLDIPGKFRLRSDNCNVIVKGGFLRNQNIIQALLFVHIFLLIPFLASAASFTGKVVKVSDGDTIQVLRNGRAEKIRLAGIDCPEKKQAFGQAAKRFTLNLAAQKVVTVEVETKDRYGRSIGEVFLPDGRSLNQELVRAGYAWMYRKYSSDATLAALESEARAARRGLWADSNPVPPWDWRRGIKKANSSELTAQVKPANSKSCGKKRYCKEMTSCAEAIYFLQTCGVSSLDRDGDGVPCESLCR
jgi:endonuclease YncB( thermonuclease family)